MKKLILTIVLLSISMATFAQVSTSKSNTEVKSKINKVTIYPDRALIEKSATINLVKGENKFTITSNATSFSKDDLHFSQNEDFFITNVSLKEVNQTFEQVSKNSFSTAVAEKINTLNNKIEQINTQIKNNNLLISAYNQQLNALKNLKAIKNTSSMDSVERIESQFVFQREQSVKLNNLLTKAKTENENLTISLNANKNELEDLIKQHNNNCNLTTKSYNIIVNIYSNRNMTTDLQYNYLVNNVSCEYFYDVMLDENLHSAIFNLKTNVAQYTNENWKNCKIVFSTNEADIVQGDSELNTWYLNNETKKTTPLAKTRMLTNNLSLMEAKAVSTDEAEVLSEVTTTDAVEYALGTASTQENLTLSREYTLNTNQVISNNDQPETIPLKFDTTEVSFKHFSTPKNAEQVYYTALLPSWDELGLQDVECNIFLNNKYVAKSYINTNSTKDTLRFSVGEDSGVKIARKVRKSSPDKGFLSSNVETTVTITLNIKNMKDKEIDLSIKDQIPISQDANIKITNVAVYPGNLNSNTGIIDWTLKLQPKEVKELKFSYTVKYPKDYNLHLN